jgi:putative membrane protein
MTNPVSDTQVSPNQNDDPRVYFAAERTFLAWIRTGLAMMGFGFVVARFGLFLREIQTVQTGMSVKSSGFSVWFGTALILMGVLVDAVSIWRHIHTVRQLNSGGAAFARPSTLAICVAIILSLVGLAMAVYLVSVRGL